MGEPTLRGRGGVSFLPDPLSVCPGLSATWTPLSPRWTLNVCLWGSQPCGQQEPASSPKHLQGLVDPATVRTPRGPTDGRAEEEADPEVRLSEGRPCPGCPQLEGVSQEHTGTVMGTMPGFQEEAVPLPVGTLM